MQKFLDRFRDGVGCVGVEFTDRLVRLLQIRSWKGSLDVAGVSTQQMPMMQHLHQLKTEVLIHQLLPP